MEQGTLSELRGRQDGESYASALRHLEASLVAEDQALEVYDKLLNILDSEPSLPVYERTLRDLLGRAHPFERVSDVSGKGHRLASSPPGDLPRRGLPVVPLAALLSIAVVLPRTRSRHFAVVLLTTMIPISLLSCSPPDSAIDIPVVSQELKLESKDSGATPTTTSKFNDLSSLMRAQREDLATLRQMTAQAVKDFKLVLPLARVGKFTKTMLAGKESFSTTFESMVGARTTFITFYTRSCMVSIEATMKVYPEGFEFLDSDATTTPTSHGTPTPTVCPKLPSLVPQAAIEAALAHPESIGGWAQLANPNVPFDSFTNPYRTSLTLRNPGSPYDPLTNGLQFRAGCQ